MLGIVIVGVTLGCLIALGIWLKRREPLKPVLDIMRAEDYERQVDNECVCPMRPDHTECCDSEDQDPQGVRTQAAAEIDAVLNPKKQKPRKTRAKSKRRSNRKGKKQ